MAHKSFEAPDKPIGPLMLKNLLKVGLAEIVAKSSAISRLVEEKTGKKMSRQRVSALMNAVNVEPETIALIAKAAGMKPSELLRDDD